MATKKTRGAEGSLIPAGRLSQLLRHNRSVTQADEDSLLTDLWNSCMSQLHAAGLRKERSRGGRQPNPPFAVAVRARRFVDGLGETAEPQLENAIDILEHLVVLHEANGALQSALDRDADIHLPCVRLLYAAAALGACRVFQTLDKEGAIDHAVLRPEEQRVRLAGASKGGRQKAKDPERVQRDRDLYREYLAEKRKTPNITKRSWAIGYGKKSQQQRSGKKIPSANRLQTILRNEKKKDARVRSHSRN